jgi:hypothetical protein
MQSYKKILIIFTLIIVFYILFRLIQKRVKLLNDEGFASISDIQDPIVKKLMSSNSLVGITDNIKDKKYYDPKKPLKDYFIKSCYHSAFNGKTTSRDMVLYLLHRGYRFLDFEVFYDNISKNETVKSAVVSIRSGGFYAKESIPLRDILDIICLHGFSSVSNRDDPLFIQIRPAYSTISSIDTPEDKNKIIAENTQLNTHIETALDKLKEMNLQYNGMINAKTTLEQIMKKAVIIMENTSNHYLQLKTNTLIKKINMNPNSMSLCFSESNMENCSSETKLVQIRPEDNKSVILPENSQPLQLIKTMSCNISPIMAWFSPFIGGYSTMGYSNLGEYELIFSNTGGSAFILLKEAKSYSEINNPNKLNSNKLSF